MCVGLSLIETSLCAQALWVDVSGALGRSPPSSYPSRERSAAKPNLGFTAFDKPSNGAPGQRAKKRQGRRDKDASCACAHAPLHARAHARAWMCVWKRISQPKNISSGWHIRVVLLCFLSCRCRRIQNWDSVNSRIPLCSYVCALKKKKKRLSSPVSILHFLLPHTRRAPAYPPRFFSFFVAVITRHKYSVCHSGLCSQRPLSAYLSAECESVILL